MKPAELLILSHAMAALFGGNMPKQAVHDRKIKHCLNCNAQHQHNNSFCSADCCKEWRASQ